MHYYVVAVCALLHSKFVIPGMQISSRLITHNIIYADSQFFFKPQDWVRCYVRMTKVEQKCGCKGVNEAY